MKLIPYRSLFDFDEFFQPFDSMLPVRSGGIVPPVDLYEKDDKLIVETALAGADPEEIDVSVENGMLTIKGSTERKTEVDEQNYYRKEVRSGSVYRQIPLPMEVKEGDAKAHFSNGMLKIELPKRSVSKEQKPIKIQVKKEKN